MSYVLKSSKRGRGNIPLYMKVVIMIIIILVFFYTFIPKALPHLFTTLAKPFWNIERDLRIGEIHNNSIINDALLKENNELKDLLGRTSKDNYTLAVVLKRPPFSAYDTFILDIGNDKKVKKGHKVYAIGNIPMGEIAEVIGNISKVILYSSSDQKFNVIIGPSAIEAIAIGKGGGFFEVSLPRDTKIKVGDIARIPSIDDSFVGTVEGIASDPSEPFSKILFRQPVNIYEMRWVLVDTSLGI